MYMMALLFVICGVVAVVDVADVVAAVDIYVGVADVVVVYVWCCHRRRCC